MRPSDSHASRGGRDEAGDAAKNIAFNEKPKSLLVTNHAGLTGLPDPSYLFAVFDVYVNDKAGKLIKNDDDD